MQEVSKFEMNTQTIKSRFVTAKSFWLIIGVVCLSLFLREIPILSVFFAPFTQFETMLHEMSHAIACVFTGGTVTGLTIVEDGNGHGGLTFTNGGIPFIYSQAGYIGEALWGSLLIALSRFPRISRAVLMVMGVFIGAACIYFMPQAILRPGMFVQAIASLVWGLALSGALIWTGKKVSDSTAHFILLFLAVQSCLSSLQGIWVLLLQSFGLFGKTWSDATNMANLTGIPAPFWGICWASFSVGMLGWVLWMTFKADQTASAANTKSITAEARAPRSIGAASPNTAQIEQDLIDLKINAGQKIKINKNQKQGR